MAVLKTQALYNFWNSFGLTAYEENTVPTGDAKPKLPYITYTALTGVFDNDVQISASLWYSGYSWAEADRKAAEISAALADGGKLEPYTDGLLWIKRGTPFSQHMADEDDTIRRIYINCSAEFLSAV